jgi:hypothetical protein
VSTSQWHLSLDKFISSNICFERMVEKPEGNMVDIMLEGDLKCFKGGVEKGDTATK